MTKPIEQMSVEEVLYALIHCGEIEMEQANEVVLRGQLYFLTNEQRLKLRAKELLKAKP